MPAKFETAFRDLISCLQTAKLYPDWHPEFKKSIDKAFLVVEELLKERDSLVIGIVGEELAFEKEIFFELSRMVQPVITLLKERGIERLEFIRGLKKEELGHFIRTLTAPKEGLKHDFQEELIRLGVRSISAGKIKGKEGLPAESAKAAEEAQGSVNFLSAYDESLDKVTDSVEKILNQEEIDHLTLRFTVSHVLENLVGRYQEFLNFATVKRYDPKTFSHIINVSILSMYFASKLGFPKEEVLELGIAALFHDIGKLYISRGILKKPARLTEDEFAKIRNHVVLGAQILLKYVDTLGVLPVVICFEHHLKFDLSGYPKLAYPRKPHIASLIVTICDVYDALSQRRNYKNDYPPKMIYELMMKEKGMTFEPVLLDKFFKFFGVWPVGTIVSLNDESIAVVREVNEGDIFSPKVEIMAPAGKKGFLDLKGAQNELRIERSLNPLTEGKPYLGLV